MFRLLGLHPGPDITACAAASLAGVPLAAARRDLDELAGAHLITEHAPGRYALHDLLRAYATEQATATDGERCRRVATRRVLDHYLHAAHAADRLINPARDQITLAARADGVQSERLADYAQAMAWFRAEHKVLLAVLALAADAGCDTHAWQIPWTMVDFCEFSGQWHDWIGTQRIAVAATRRLEDRAAQARCGRALGYAYAKTGRDSDAVDHLRRALRLFRESGDPIGEARTHQDLSWMLDRQGRPALALRHDRIALRLYEQAGHTRGQANALNAIGWLHAMLGDYHKTVDHCRKALVLHRELGNRRGEAAALDSLGYAYHHLGRHSESVACCRKALGLFRELGDRFYEAEVLAHLGDAYHVAGHPGQARDAWQQALAILDDLHHPDAGHLRAKLGTACV
jgi:tetratricopeptide (TPR) repeat protein